MPARKFIPFALLATYVTTIAAMTCYHAEHFPEYFHRRGDETLYYTAFLLASSILWQIVLALALHRLHGLAFVLSTFLNFILSFIAGFFILMVSGLAGTPAQMMFTYGSCFLLVFTVVAYKQIAGTTSR